MKLAASILAADFTRLGDQIAACEAAGVDWIHVDVMDGQFVPNITMGPQVVEAVRRATRLPLDVHLMIVAPERYLADFAAAGADSLTVQVEACPNLHRTLQQIKELGKRAGVALNPGTPAMAVSEVLDLADLLLPMTVNPGFWGQRFLPTTLAKVRQLSDWVTERELGTDIEVDGGLDPVTAPQAQAAGATVMVVGSAVFKTSGTIAEAVAHLRRSVTPPRR
jgi:ribulose-phosphate 3-epimerase